MSNETVVNGEQRSLPLPVKVKLTGTDCNVFALIGRVRTAMKKAGYKSEAIVFSAEVMAAGSYDKALQVIMKWVDVD
jgi:hypothetical protein